MSNVHFTKFVPRIQRQGFALYNTWRKEKLFFSISALHTKVSPREHELHPSKDPSKDSTLGPSFPIPFSHIWRWASLPWKRLLKCSPGEIYHDQTQVEWHKIKPVKALSLSVSFVKDEVSRRVRKVGCVGGEIWFSRILDDLGFTLFLYQQY